MDKPPIPPSDRPGAPAVAPVDQRQSRLASALRANLKRRKAAAPPKPSRG